MGAAERVDAEELWPAARSSSGGGRLSSEPAPHGASAEWRMGVASLSGMMSVATIPPHPQGVRCEPQPAPHGASAEGGWAR